MQPSKPLQQRPFLSGTDMPRAPLLSDVIRLYASNVLFRTCSELAVIGMIVLLATGQFSGAATSLTKAFHSLSPFKPQQMSLNQFKVAGNNEAPGLITLTTLSRLPLVSKDVMVAESPEIVTLMENINSLLEKNSHENNKAAYELVRNYNHSRPIIAYARGVVSARFSGAKNYKIALRLLTFASQNGIGDATLWVGRIYLTALVHDMAGKLPADHRVILNREGAAHPATTKQLGQAATIWLEKAAGAGHSAALRYLAFMKARGMSGEIDFASAAALWKQAADKGDAVSQLELGKILAFGHGVEASADEAARYLRKASAVRPDAKVALASVLLAKALAGDASAATEAIENATAFLNGRRPAAQLRSANRVLAELYYRAAPSDMRDADRAVSHYRAASYFGDIGATVTLAGFTRWGTHIEKNLQTSYTLYAHAARNGIPDLQDKMAEIKAGLTPAEQAKLSKLRVQTWRDRPNSGNGSGQVQLHSQYEAFNVPIVDFVQ